MSMSPKWHLAYFVSIDGHFGQIGRYGIQIFFGCLNQKSATDSMCKIHIYIDSGTFRQIHRKM